MISDDMLRLVFVYDARFADALLPLLQMNLEHVTTEFLRNIRTPEG